MSVKFTINGKKYTVSSVDAETSLNSFLRNTVNLRGTKAMCHEAGCGVCIVAVKVIHPVTKQKELFSVNSCIVSILSCHNWEITTVEGIGNKNGYHPIQKRLADFDGTQCGFCSPGWVMNMYSLLEVQPNMTMKEVENSFASNICRCTGYRPIADAFKSFAKDVDPKTQQKLRDIEDLSFCAKTGSVCTKTCDDYSEDGFCIVDAEMSYAEMGMEPRMLEMTKEETRWYKVYKVSDIFNVFNKEGTESNMLVVGNTAQGVYPVKEFPKVIIDITGVSELRKYVMDANLTLGGIMPLNEVMDVFKKVANENSYFKYTLQMNNHLDLVAHIPVRNIGSIAGNLSIKHKHTEFPSDVFLLFETVGGVITIGGKDGNKEDITLSKFLKTNMNGKVIYSVSLPPLSEDYRFDSHKIMQRAQNTHAMVNAGFLFKISSQNIIERSSIVYGGINPDFIHATATEAFLIGKNIFKDAILQLALFSLSDEIFPESQPPEPSPEYRKRLAISLFYKTILNICDPKLINDRYKSGGIKYDRPVSRGEQKFDTDKANYPLNEPVHKLEGMAQCSGEAKFSNDLPTMPNEVYAAFVVSKVYSGTIDKMDATEVLAMKGVVAFYTASDIPGSNNFTPQNPFLPAKEEIISSGKILFHGQPIAIIVAETEKLAKKAAELVKVTYKNKNTTPPLLTSREVLKSPSAKERTLIVQTVEPKEKGTDVQNIIKGSFDIHGQYHYTMETQTCVCIPIEDGLDVFSSTQYIDLTQAAIAEMLNIPLNSINLNVRRLGGGYGAKISRSIQVATACALAAFKLDRPVRFVLPIDVNLMAIGKRLPCSNDYEVGIDKDGKIQYLKNYFFQDNGCSHNEMAIILESANALVNSYDDKTWYLQGSSVLTDTPSNTWCRAPGSTEGHAMIENIMDHIAVTSGIDPIKVRLQNMSADNPLPDMIESFRKSTNYDERHEQIKEYNSQNRWRKRGISLTPLTYNLNYFGNYASFVAIYQADGSVAVCHAGIEMGQGLNTKVAQVCAHTLQIPLASISVKPSNSLVTPNAIVSGGSITSETCSFATIKACQILLDRLEPIKKSMDNPTWVELVQKAYASGVDLSAHYMCIPQAEIKKYQIYGITITEVEIDVLTGNHQVLRVDILEDVGESLSPNVDVGQVEGAYIMGMGYWTTEKLVYDEKSGALLTNRTWTYKPPGMKDIPLDLRVQFRRNAPNPAGVLRSKATGEPPLNMAYGIYSALRQAVTSARVESGLPENEYFDFDVPCTPESIMLAASTRVNELKIT